MTSKNSRFSFPRSLPLPFTYAAQQLNHLQADLVLKARLWAADEVGAAMAHQLNEPLTALLLYLHEIKEVKDHPAATATLKTTPLSSRGSTRRCSTN